MNTSFEVYAMDTNDALRELGEPDIPRRVLMHLWHFTQSPGIAAKHVIQMRERQRESA